MTAEEKRILETFARIIPALPDEDKAYLLGFGEGLGGDRGGGQVARLPHTNNSQEEIHMTRDDLNKILELHKKWLNGDPDGKRAYLSGCDLRYSNLSGSNLSGSDLRRSNLSGSNLSGSDLRHSNLSGSNLRHSNLSGSDLRGCNLSGSDLSGSDGLISPIQYMDQHFERCSDGYIAYKTFNALFSAPDEWDIAPGAVIEETVNANRTDICGCGINVAPLDWVKQRYETDIWKVLIRWEWLPGVCVPYNTDGKIRCERVQLLEVVK